MNSPLQCWEGREWVHASSTPLKSENVPRIRIVSYRVCADFKAPFLHYSTNTAWDSRSRMLLHEIANYDADVVCLHDIDHFEDFWYPQLLTIGYDCVYMPRTQEKDFHYEGIVIASRMNRLKVFKSTQLQFNRAPVEESQGTAFRDRCQSDDVALVLFLRSMIDNDLPSAFCVTCAMFSDIPHNGDVRAHHAKYLANEIEKLNRDFQVPVIICANLNDAPQSASYALFRTGRTPLVAQIPPRPTKVRATPTSRASALVQWFAPKLSLADPNIDAYIIAWRPGGSTILGFKSQVKVVSGDCIKYVESFDSIGRKKATPLLELQYHVTGLVAEVPYEFRVCAVNDIGEGVWSESSKAILLPNPENAPALPPLPLFKSMESVIQMQEADYMRLDDLNTNNLFKVDILNPSTSLTPRRLDGSVNTSVATSRILPLSMNARSGWKESLNGNMDASLVSELNRKYILSKSLLRDETGFKDPSINIYDDRDIASKLRTQNNSKEQISSDDGSTFLLDGREVMSHIGDAHRRHVHGLMLRSAYESYSSGAEPFITTCNPKTAECVDYIFYSSHGMLADKVLAIPTFSMLQRGETPEESLSIVDVGSRNAFACLAGNFDKLLDNTFRPALSMGSNSYDLRLNSDQYTKSDVQDLKRILKKALNKSHGNDSVSVIATKAHPTNSNATTEIGFWGGRWSPFPSKNNSRTNAYLPNSAFGSTHFAIGVDLVFDEDLLASCLNQPVNLL